MPKEKRTAIASLGGTIAHQVGTAHEWDEEEAREAGRKGGAASAKKRAEAKAAA